MSLTSNIYGLRDSGIAHGDVFTLPQIVARILDFAGYTDDRDLSKLKILEPSCGHGAFLKEILRRIAASARRHGFDPAEAVGRNVFAYEIDEQKITRCKSLLTETFPDTAGHINYFNEDFLLNTLGHRFDFIVGNPPYVRYDNIPSDLRKQYQALFKSFHQRVDIYVLFFEKCLRMLAPDGIHAFVCANRWLKNEYGRRLRELVFDHFHLSKFYDIEKIKAFEEDVLAYPAITIIKNNPSDHMVRCASFASMEELYQPFEMTLKRLTDRSEWTGLFHCCHDNASLRKIEEQGFKIGIGVATGADNVFISEGLDSIVEHQLLLPAIGSKNLTGRNGEISKLWLLNPYDENGRLIDLDSYPLAKDYLSRFREKLQGRYIATKGGKGWYSTIDRIDPALVGRPKILIPDISGRTDFFIDEGNFYPLHNLYYITHSDIGRLRILASMLMSDFAKAQVAGIANQMNGGYLRWQSQTLRKLLLPDCNSIAPDLKARLIDGYTACNFKQINDTMTAVLQTNTSVPLKEPCWHQQTLF